MSGISATSIISELKNSNVTHVVGLPDNGSRVLFEHLQKEPEIELVPVTREGEAFAVASGLFIGGKQPFVIIQNTGLLESGDAFRGTAFNMGIPLVMLVGYRGYGSIDAEPEKVDSAATFLEPTLKAWNIPYWLCKQNEDVVYIAEAFRKANETMLPSAVIYTGDTS
jgi:sulfopyruvate decarboxylase subunit alpha